MLLILIEICQDYILSARLAKEHTVSSVGFNGLTLAHHFGTTSERGFLRVDLISDVPQAQAVKRAVMVTAENRKLLVTKEACRSH